MTSAQDLKSAGLKATLPRLRIINLFESARMRHLTAEEVYRLLQAEGLEIGLATVYRVLTQFEQAGLLIRHHFESGKAVFELNEGKHHDHLVCMQCGRVEEFFDPEIEKRQQQDRRRARLRDQRARALPVRRVHEAAVPASQGRHLARRRPAAAAASASRWLKSARRKPSSHSVPKYASAPPATTSARWPTFVQSVAAVHADAGPGQPRQHGGEDADRDDELAGEHQPARGAAGSARAARGT